MRRALLLCFLVFWPLVSEAQQQDRTNMVGLRALPPTWTYDAPNMKGITYWWPLNDANARQATPVAYDYFNGLTLTGSAAVMNTAYFPYYGWAVRPSSFDGLYFSGSSPTALTNMNRNWSFSGWVNFTILDTYAVFSLGSGGVYIRLNANKIEVLRSQNSVELTSAASLVAESWYHLVVTCTSGGTLSIYLNGALDNSGATAVTFAGSGTAWIGAEHGAAEKAVAYFTDFRIYLDYTLSPAEVLRLYRPETRWRTTSGRLSHARSIVAAATRRILPVMQ